MPLQLQWLNDFVAHWRQFGRTRQHLPLFYAVLERLSLTQPRIPPQVLSELEPESADERLLMDLWCAWNAFVSNDWWRAIQKIELVCEKLPGLPEPWIVLTLVQLANGNRMQAYEALRRALSVDPSDQELRQLLGKLGIRRRPIVPFLPRSNRVNVTLGRLRHKVLGPSVSAIVN